MDADFAGRIVRAVRYARRINQRELAQLAGVPRSTIERIESAKVVPRLDTLLAVLAGAGFRLAPVDHRGNLLELHPDRDLLVDRAGRHLPSHLRPVPTLRYQDAVGPGYWWGWHHVAWPYADDRHWVPSHTYWRRCQPDVVSLVDSFMQRVWDDAT